jgi:hypothetical protein
VGNGKGPIGVRAHLTGNQEMGMKATGYGRRVRNRRPLRHMLKGNNVCCLWCEEKKR